MTKFRKYCLYVLICDRCSHYRKLVIVRPTTKTKLARRRHSSFLSTTYYEGGPFHPTREICFIPETSCVIFELYILYTISYPKMSPNTSILCGVAQSKHSTHQLRDHGVKSISTQDKSRVSTTNVHSKKHRSLHQIYRRRRTRYGLQSHTIAFHHDVPSLAIKTASSTTNTTTQSTNRKTKTTNSSTYRLHEHLLHNIVQETIEYL